MAATQVAVDACCLNNPLFDKAYVDFGLRYADRGYLCRPGLFILPRTIVTLERPCFGGVGRAWSRSCCLCFGVILQTTATSIPLLVTGKRDRYEDASSSLSRLLRVDANDAAAVEELAEMQAIHELDLRVGKGYLPSSPPGYY